jgi:hypothetical protein
MATYIVAVDIVAQFAMDDLPPDELIAATKALSHPPVSGYAAFDVNEVRLIGQYRLAVSAEGGYETVWPSIVRGLPEAWVYAVHEAAEIQAFADLGVNPFAPDEFMVYLEEAHIRATLAELRFLKDWSKQSNLEASELAIEVANLERAQFKAGHARLLNELRGRQGWSLPTAREIEIAAEFWRLLRAGSLL